MQTDYERTRDELLEVNKAVRAHPTEDVTFDALCCFEADLEDRFYAAPARNLADVREKIGMFFAVNGRPLSAEERLLRLIAEDLDRLFPEHAPRPAKHARKRRGKAA